jgi:hypothetical protein
VVSNFSERVHLEAEGTFRLWVLALYRLVSDLVLLENTSAASFANHLHELAPVEFVSSHEDLFVGQLV